MISLRATDCFGESSASNATAIVNLFIINNFLVQNQLAYICSCARRAGPAGGRAPRPNRPKRFAHAHDTRICIVVEHCTSVCTP